MLQEKGSKILAVPLIVDRYGFCTCKTQPLIRPQRASPSFTSKGSVRTSSAGTSGRSSKSFPRNAADVGRDAASGYGSRSAVHGIQSSSPANILPTAYPVRHSNLFSSSLSRILYSWHAFAWRNATPLLWDWTMTVPLCAKHGSLSPPGHRKETRGRTQETKTWGGYARHRIRAEQEASEQGVR